MNSLCISVKLLQLFSQIIIQKVASSLSNIMVISRLKAYQLPGLFNEYLAFSGVNSFVSAEFMETIDCIDDLLDHHLKARGVYSCHTDTEAMNTSSIIFIDYFVN